MLPRAWAAVAAAVIVVCAGTAVVVAQHAGRGAGGRSTAAAPAAPATTNASPRSPAGAPASGSAIPVPALGRIDSPTALVDALRADSAPGGAALQAKSAPPTGSSAGQAAHSSAALQHCEAQAATLAGAGARTAPVLKATLTYGATPALAFVFTRSGGHIGIVVRANDCASLVTVRF